MITVIHSVTWEDAVQGLILHKQAVRSKLTARFYATYAKRLAEWAEESEIPLDSFTKRHLDAYLVYRSNSGKKPTTLHHDALVATVLFEWAKSNDLIDRDPLAEYKVRNAPKTYKYMPSSEDVRLLFEAIKRFYEVAENPEIKYFSPAKRSFHRERVYAIELVKLDSACRIGEIVNFKVDDFQPHAKQLTIRESKGREPRVLPVSSECVEALNVWLKIRRRVMSNVSANEDEGWLFISETGGRANEGNYLRSIKKIARFAGLPEGINNHSQRRFSLNNMAKQGGILFAQGMAGHKDPKTTLTYLKIDGDFMREKHNEVGLLRGILNSNRSAKRKRLV